MFRRKRLLVGLFIALASLPLSPQVVLAYRKIPPGQSLLVMNRPHTDLEKFKERLKKRGLVVVNEVRCKTDQFSVLEVQPQSGSINSALASFRASADPDLEAAEIKVKTVRTQCVPAIDDPSFASQANLQQINFGEMYCLLDAMGKSQVEQPRVTVIDCGVSTIANDMMDVQQYNFAGGAPGVSETPVDGGVHGTSVSAVACATTNNGSKIAGVASHAGQTVKVISCRVSDDGTTIDTLDAIRAMTWCVDHPTERGGRGVVNISINSFGLPKYNGSPVVQAIAKSALKQKDLFVNAAGNDSLEDPSKEQSMRRVAAIDSNDEIASFSNYGKFKAVAPGVLVPTWDRSTSSVQFGTGTSYAAPHWSAAIALLMSLNPELTAPKADKILESTGIKTAQKKIKPDLRAAILKALK